MTANVAPGSSTGLYGGSIPRQLNSAQTLYGLLSNSGTVDFALTAGNVAVSANVEASGVTAGTYGNATTVSQFTVGADGRITQAASFDISQLAGTYGNANVAAYLPTDSTIIGLTANAATQAVSINFLLSNAATQGTEINLLNANLSAFESYANITFGTSSYGNANVAIYLPTDSTIIGLTANAATQADAIQTLSANLGAFETYANLTFGPSSPSSYSNANVASYLPTYSGSLENSSSIINLWSNAATQSADITTLFANAATQADAIQTLNANLGAFETYANATFVTSSYGNSNVATYLASGFGSNSITTTGNIQAGVIKTAEVRAINSGGGTLKNSNGATQASWGAGGGDNFAISVSTNLNGANAQIDISPTGTGHVHIKPTGTGAVEIAPVNPGTINNMVIGNVTPQSANFTTVAATGNVSASYFLGDGSQLTGLPAAYGNLDVAAYLPGYSGNLNSVNNLTVSGKLFSDDITATAVLVDGDATITGNLFVQGNVTTINSNVVTTNDKTITLANNVSSASLLSGAGVEAGLGGIATLLYDYSTNSWQSNIAVTPTTDNTLALGGPANRWSTVYAGAVVSPTIDTLDANLGTATTNITTLFANAATQSTAINTLDANLGVATNNITTLFSNAASQAVSINTLDANLGVATNNITTLFANAATQATAIQTLDANVGAFETYANLTFSTSAGFSGNLNGNVLYDSVNNRLFANAFPLSTPAATAGTNYNNFIVTKPTYISGVLQPPASATTGVITTAVTSSNIAMRSSYQTANNRNTAGIMQYTQIWPTTANIMTSNDRIRAVLNSTDIMLSGKTWGTMSTASVNNNSLTNVNNNMNIIGTGEAAGVIAQYNVVQSIPTSGSANIQYATATQGFVGYATGAGATASNIAYARLYSGQISGATSTFVITNAIGLHLPSGWPSNATNKYAILNEDVNSVIQTNGNINALGNVTISGKTQLVTYAETSVGLGNISGTVTVNVALGSIFSGTVTGNITLNQDNFTNFGTGQSVTIILIQDGTGGRTLTSNLKYAGGSKTLSTAGGACDTITVTNFGGAFYLAGLVKGYA